MSLIILIHEIDGKGQRVKTYTYAKSANTPIEKVKEFAVFIEGNMRVFVTGNDDAIRTQDRLTKALQKFGRFEVERVQNEGRTEITANSRIFHGAIKPINTRGG